MFDIITNSPSVFFFRNLSFSRDLFKRDVDVVASHLYLPRDAFILSEDPNRRVWTLVFRAFQCFCHLIFSL